MPTKRFYVTTPIYYVNDAPHIGHSYTTVLADVLARFYRLRGAETFFLTGTDEHGQKVQQAAEKHGLSPQEHCDRYSQRFRDTWKKLEIHNDKFIRTTDPEHVAFVQQVLQKLQDGGHIYTKEYEGWYSTSEERFFTEKELVNGKDPISGRPVEYIQEKNYFFRMSGFQDWLIQYIHEHPEFILPDFRKNEVLGFLAQPLNDLCISRPKSRLGWGITLPFDEDYVAYVWVDALFNYRSAVEGLHLPSGEDIWPADYHIIGKDILTTHAVYWPTMLKAVGYAQPKTILAHGWWMRDEARISKTTGNVVNPMEMMERYGVDAFRYFLLRDMVLGQDASYSEPSFIQRINSDLANDLGNGLNRVLRQTAVHLEGRLSPCESSGEEEKALKEVASATPGKVLSLVEDLKTSFAVEEVMQLVRAVNRYLEQTAPWKLAKQDPKPVERLNEILYHSAEALRIAVSLLLPVIPGKAREALHALGVPEEQTELVWGGLRDVVEVAPQCVLFPRIEVAAKESPGDAGSTKEEPKDPPVGSDPFAKLLLKVGKVIQVEDHPEAEGLYVLQVDMGDEKRSICAGLRKHVSAEQLANSSCLVVANLKPAKLRGVESRGMLLAADSPDGRVIPLHPNAEPGTVALAEGIEPSPKKQIGIKDFEKCPLEVRGGIVSYQGKPLKVGGKPIDIGLPDGCPIH